MPTYTSGFMSLILNFSHKKALCKKTEGSLYNFLPYRPFCFMFEKNVAH